MPRTQSQDWLTTREVASVLECTTSTIRGHLIAGRFPHARRASNGWLIPRQDIDKFKAWRAAHPQRGGVHKGKPGISKTVAGPVTPTAK